MKSIRALGLGAIIALTITALAGAATASASQFRTDSYPVAISGQQATQNVIKTKTGSIKCTTVVQFGTLASASSSVSFAPEFAGCTAFGAAATISANSCSYVFQSTNDTAPYTGTMGVACGKGGDSLVIEPTGLSCQVTIPAQSSAGNVEFTASGLNAHRAITATLKLTTLKYTEAGSECAAPGTRETGTDSGSTTLTGGGAFPASLYLANEQIASGPTLLRAESYPAIFEGGPASATLSTKAGKINGTLKLQGNLAAASGSATLTPTFSGFTYFGAKVSVANNGCSFGLKVATEASSPLSVECEKAGSAISFKPAGISCETTIPAQSGLNYISLGDLGAGTSRTILAGLHISGMKYTETGAECPAPGTHEDGSLVSEVTLSGYKNEGGTKGAPQGLWAE